MMINATLAVFQESSRSKVEKSSISFLFHRHPSQPNTFILPLLIATRNYNRILQFLFILNRFTSSGKEHVSQRRQISTPLSRHPDVQKFPAEPRCGPEPRPGTVSVSHWGRWRVRNEMMKGGNLPV